uniref:Uncharacterized protein n=1 Tax=Romanomermis culicivorax TaxID=13658 RepID=A0A915JL88_ROMCU
MTRRRGGDGGFALHHQVFGEISSVTFRRCRCFFRFLIATGDGQIGRFIAAASQKSTDIEQSFQVRSACYRLGSNRFQIMLFKISSSMVDSKVQFDSSKYRLSTPTTNGKGAWRTPAKSNGHCGM